MSAYLVTPEHIGVLAQYAAQAPNPVSVPHGSEREMETRVETFARLLGQANIDSVEHRYPDTAENGAGVEFGGVDSNTDYLLRCRMEARRLLDRRGHLFADRLMRAVMILKMCDCYEYQSCETPEWYGQPAHKNPARAVLEAIRSRAINSLPGYEDAPWGYQNPTPELVSV